MPAAGVEFGLNRQREAQSEMEEKNPAIRIAVLGILVVIIGAALSIAIVTKSALFFLGFLIPLLTFFTIFVFMSLQRKKILKRLNVSFGENVVKISSAIMDYFELPMTLLLSITLTLFFFAFSLLAVIFWADYLAEINNIKSF